MEITSDVLIKRLSKGDETSSPVWGNSRVLRNSVVDGGYHRLEILESNVTKQSKPGQFVMLSPPDGKERTLILPRPMAIHRKHEKKGTFEVLFKIVGSGTARLAQIQSGEEIYVLGPLGNGFQMPKVAKEVLLIGRGIGICSHPWPRRHKRGRFP